MNGKPKFSEFRAWVMCAPERKTNGDRLPLPSLADGKERQTQIKVAQFLVLVALLFVLADQLGHIEERTDANFAPDSTALVNLILYPPQRLENSSKLIVRFRLSNKGNHTVFYPTGTMTSAPVGQLVAHAYSTSDWLSRPSNSEQRVPAAKDFKNSNLRWIEMPPGGWVDGQYRDVGESQEQHAYVI